MATVYDYIERNKRKSLILVALFPVSFALFAYISVLLGYLLWGVLRYNQSNNIWSFASLWHQSFLSAHELCKWVLPLAVGLAIFWAWQAWKQGDQIVLENVPLLRRLDKFEAYDAYTLLENLCISTGDYMPQLYVIDDDSMNAFAVGMDPMHGGIVLSSGLLKNLDRVQLEAVLAHELAHIRHYDTRVMVIIITCVAFFTFAGEMLFFGQERDSIGEGFAENVAPFQRTRGMPLLVYVGGMLLIYGYFLAPFLRFALSRTCESLADGQAVLATRHPRALISALWKIEKDSRIEALDTNSLLGGLCIARPKGEETLFERLSGIGRTHPPIEERIRDLNDMDGLFLKSQIR